MKKSIAILLFILVFICGCDKKDNNVNNVDSTQVVEKDKAKESTSASTNTTTIKKTTNIPDTKTTKKSTTNRTTTKSTKKTISKKTTTTKNNDKLPTCSDNDPGLIAFIKKNEKEYGAQYFNTLKEAKEYGNYAGKYYGYGYWYSPTPMRGLGTIYRGETCYKELYEVSLYILANTCQNDSGEWNKIINIPSTPKNKLVSDLAYLRNLGYKCEGKRLSEIN